MERTAKTSKRLKAAQALTSRGRSGGKAERIRRRALRILQDPDHPVYLFALTADEIQRVADISRTSRDDEGELIGYQRPEVKQHVNNIEEYLDSSNGRVLFPNSVILALSSSIVFKAARGPKVDRSQVAVAGTIELVLPKHGEQKPAWIVDGQQRALALRKSQRRDFPVPVSAFVADDVDTQREQFLRVNSTKPLPRGLISELLPRVSTVLPPKLAAKKAPAALCDILARDPESPFYGLVKRNSGTSDSRGEEVVQGTVLLQVVQASLQSASGCLFPYRNYATGETDYVNVRKVLLIYWGAVRDTFPEAWGKPAKESRLMHGAGLKAMGKLMDRVMATVRVEDPNATSLVRGELSKIRNDCCWTEGTWEELGLEWDEVQNVSAHVRAITNSILRAYLRPRSET